MMVVAKLLWIVESRFGLLQRGESIELRSVVGQANQFVITALGYFL